MTKQKSESTVRFELAEMAARLIAVDGVADYKTAKRKAAERLGIAQQKHLPSNREIEAALINYQRLFQGDTQPAIVRRLRECALEAMDFFRDFHPYLTGSVLKGTATGYSSVHLIIYTDCAEDVDRLLIDHGLPYELVDRIVKFKPEQEECFPCYQFLVRDTRITLTVFPRKRNNQTPLSQTDGRQMQRASAARVRTLLSAQQDDHLIS
ncbi:MAG: nucleotidyltransferase domain-containing protein [Thiotrichales bacterium]|nr:nucleotidyltransferase domain-containing protein [Thiotrichales bacterium]